MPAWAVASGRVAAPEVDVAALVLPRSFLAFAVFGTLLRVQMCAPVAARECRRQDLRRPLAGQAAAGAEQRGPVDRVVAARLAPRASEKAGRAVFRAR